MTNQAVKTIVLAFTKVIRIGDTYVTVRTRQGEVIKVPAPYDKTLKLRSEGEGTVQCPRYLLS